MPRKFVRRFLPSHDSVRNHRFICRFGPWLQHAGLWYLNRRTVAGGVAAGLFAGLVPGSNPVQFAVGALLAILFRVNLPIAVVVTLYSNPFTVVPLYYVAYKLGQLVLMQPGEPVPPMHGILEGRAWQEWLPALLEWAAHVGKPLLAGLPLLALLLAAAGYLIVIWSWQAHVGWSWHRRKRRRRKGGR